ncbi:lipid A deacylase LpxR family protein [Marinimicrobium alkaliphilum]|uniref:lipid A deacylase LpxR family protein n=1 Tax=Marinimicrobium alkaliphilum TaxID=2202654 RepID=UPI000DB9A193|nr:lipid A deacylase LpxR family protein [Marinimicrobium alkaliphilum]
MDYFIKRRPVTYLVALILLLSAHGVLAEPERASWALAMDNDILALGGKDQDYTYGFNFTYTGLAAKRGWYSLDAPLGWIDSVLGVEGLSSQGVSKHSIEVGMFGFTPNDIEAADPLPGDRPYASLVYWSNAREQLDARQGVAWKSTLAVGVLGLDLVGQVQNESHALFDSTPVRGWSHQVSNGGEPTARYTLARQQHVATVLNNLEVKSTVQGSVGYLTEASWSLSVRGGRYHTAWSSFNPELVSYGEKSSYTNSSLSVDEHYFWGGVSVKARAYNAFLQGQFRDSTVTLDRDELRTLLVEAWLGYTVAFSQGYRVSYVLRGHSSEIRQGEGDRNLLWGGLILSRSFR